MRSAAPALALLAIAVLLAAPTCDPASAPTAALVQITHKTRVREFPAALSDRFAAYEGVLNALWVYDRNSGATTEVARDFLLGGAASDDHVAWVTPFGGSSSVTYFLRVWEAATGRVSLLDLERGHTFLRARRERASSSFLISEATDLPFFSRGRGLRRPFAELTQRRQIVEGDRRASKTRTFAPDPTAQGWHRAR